MLHKAENFPCAGIKSIRALPNVTLRYTCKRCNVSLWATHRASTWCIVLDYSAILKVVFRIASIAWTPSNMYNTALQTSFTTHLIWYIYFHALTKQPQTCQLFRFYRQSHTLISRFLSPSATFLKISKTVSTRLIGVIARIVHWK